MRENLGKISEPEMILKESFSEGKAIIRNDDEKWLEPIIVEFETNENTILDRLETIRQEYNTSGVWAMYGCTCDGWECLQVAQKSSRTDSIGKEIVHDIEVMYMEVSDESACTKCDEVCTEDRAFYKNVYYRHKCEECNDRESMLARFCATRRLRRPDSIVKLSRNYDIYHIIKKQYKHIRIVLVKLGGERNEVCGIERQYAEKYLAIYFHDLAYAKKK